MRANDAYVLQWNVCDADEAVADGQDRLARDRER
jgi:hypothetical protein